MTINFVIRVKPGSAPPPSRNSLKPEFFSVFQKKHLSRQITQSYDIEAQIPSRFLDAFLLRRDVASGGG
jgi:hypothetical protein